MTDTMTPDVAIVPANEASWEDLQAVLGTGYPSRCECQRFKIRGRAWDSDSVSVGERARRLRKQTGCGQPEADTTSGLVAYLDGEPAGWCAVEPRTARDAVAIRRRRRSAAGRRDRRTHRPERRPRPAPCCRSRSAPGHP